jgi:3-phosphoshikimate 1-carboxyvinyltransferase
LFVAPGALRGQVRAPPSKSVTLRALVAAALADGESRIECASTCADAQAAIGALTAMGARFTRQGMAVTVQGARERRGGTIACGESGLLMRMLAPIAALSSEEAILEASGSLARRPVGMLEAPLRALGAECSTAGGLPPVKLRGPLQGGAATVDAASTSQLLTGLLFALPLCARESVLEVPALASRGYVQTTLEVLASFGVHCQCDPTLARFTIAGAQRFRPGSFVVEGDWSAAAFLLVAGALAGEVGVQGLRLDSTQVDERILEVLAGCGAALEVGEQVRAGADVLRAFTCDVEEAPDLLPPLATLACGCEGTTEITGIARTRQKESDRVAALTTVLGALGAEVRAEPDRLLIRGGHIKGGTVDAHGDHRIAMAAAIVALRAAEPVEIVGAECVAKSYPAFFEDLEELRA